MRFLFKLASHLHKSLSEILELSSAELTYWFVLFGIEPWGEWREDYHAALISSILINVNTIKGPRVSVNDMMPAWNKLPSRQCTDAEISGYFIARWKRENPDKELNR